MLDDNITYAEQGFGIDCNDKSKTVIPAEYITKEN